MAGRAEQDEAMPDRVLEAQPLPRMEDHAGGIQHAARERETQRQCRQLLHHRVIEHHAAPAHGEVQCGPRPGQSPVASRSYRPGHAIFSTMPTIARHHTPISTAMAKQLSFSCMMIGVWVAALQNMK